MASRELLKARRNEKRAIPPPVVRSARSAGHVSRDRAGLKTGFRHSDDPTSLRRAAIEAETALKRAALAANEAATQAMLVADALGEAIVVLGRETEASVDSPANAEGLVETLSPRQREVLALVAAGHSNRTIAETLFVSPNTVKTHVASLLTKLHADTRVQLAAIAVRHGAH